MIADELTVDGWRIMLSIGWLQMAALAWYSASYVPGGTVGMQCEWCGPLLSHCRSSCTLTGMLAFCCVMGHALRVQI